MKLSKHFDTNIDLMLKCPCCGKADFDEEYIEKLERVRVATGIPLGIVSGFRCEKHNKKIGGSEGSEHTLGLAVDVRVLNSGHRAKLIYYGFQLGFSRFGIEKTTLHIGGGNADTGHPEWVTWHYYKRYRRK